jgi:hypothetical protein
LNHSTTRKKERQEGKREGRREGRKEGKQGEGGKEGEREREREGGRKEVSLSSILVLGPEQLWRYGVSSTPGLVSKAENGRV